MAQEPVTRSAGSKALIPDDFTPEWSKSVSTSYGNVSCLNVPVSSFTGYKARYMQGKERIVNIAQKLVVFKNTDTGEKTQFLLTLLPCYGYVNAHKGEDIAGLFMQGGTKSGFSGLALYISPESGIVYGVSSFVNGHRTGTATCSSDKATKQQLTALVRRASFCQFFATRAGMEDFGWDYNMGVEVEDGNMLPEVIVTPPGGMPYVENAPFNQWLFDNFNDPEDPPGVDRTENDNNCGYCPGDGYGHCIGGGGTTTSGGGNGDYSQVKRKVITYKVDEYPGYGSFAELEGKMTELDCMGVCKKIMDNMHLDYAIKQIQLWKENKNFDLEKAIKDDDAAFKALVESAVKEIIRHIDAGRPMIVGINHSPGSRNKDKTTDHFVLIIGYDYGYCEEDGKNELCFIYIETARTKEMAADAVSDKTVLYYNEDTGMIHGKKYNGHKDYTVVQIRPNF